MKSKLIYKLALSSSAILILLLCISIGCKKSSNSTPTATQGPNEVWIQSMAFGPATLTVAVNTTITWTNKDGYAHTVTSDTGLFDSGNVNGSGAYSFKFTTAGTYPYHCNIHSNMHASIIVH